MEVYDIAVQARAAPAAAKPKPTKADEAQQGVGFKESLEEQVSKQKAPKREKPVELPEDKVEAKPVCEAVVVPVVLVAALEPNMTSEILPADAAGEVQASSENGAAAAALLANMAGSTETVSAPVTDAGSSSIQTGTTGSVETQAAGAVLPEPQTEEANAELQGEVTGTVVAAPSEAEIKTSDPRMTDSSRQVSGEGLHNIHETSQSQVSTPVMDRPTAASKPESTMPERIIGQVTDSVKGMMEHGQKVYNIHMQPEELGKINVRLSSGQDGVKVLITADRAATGELLENSIRQLQEKFSAAGIEIGEMSISYYQNQSQKDQSEWQSDHTSPGSEIRSIHVEEKVKSGPIWGGSKNLPDTALDFMA